VGSNPSIGSEFLKFIGEILKRPTRADCKSVGFTFAGSNPALPTSGFEKKILTDSNQLKSKELGTGKI
jgi:hypothetical protein